MYRRVLMSFALKSGACADCEGQTGALSGADVRKSRICLILRINIHPLARSACNPGWKLPALHKAGLHPFFAFFPLPFPLHLSVTLRGVGRDTQPVSAKRTEVPRAPSVWPVASPAALPTLPTLCCNCGGEVKIKTKGGNGAVNGSLQPAA